MIPRPVFRDRVPVASLGRRPLLPCILFNRLERVPFADNPEETTASPEETTARAENRDSAAPPTIQSLYTASWVCAGILTKLDPTKMSRRL